MIVEAYLSNEQAAILALAAQRSVRTIDEWVADALNNALVLHERLGSQPSPPLELAEYDERVRRGTEGNERAKAEYDAEHGEGSWERRLETLRDEGRERKAAAEYDVIRDEVLRAALGRLRRERESGGVEGGSAAEMIARMDAELLVEQRRDRERRGERCAL